MICDLVDNTAIKITLTNVFYQHIMCSLLCVIFEWKAPAGFLTQSKYICAVCTFCAFLCFWLSLVNEWPPTGQIAVHSAYDMFS